MKLATALTTPAALAASVSAQCRVFKFKVENSPNTDLNGLYLQNIGGNAGISSPTGTEISAFWDDVAPVELTANGVNGERAGNFMLVPSDSSGSEQLVFADFAVAEARFSDWHIKNDILTYGDAADQFKVFPSDAADGSFYIYWVPAGTFTTSDSFTIDLKLECL